MIEQPAAMFAAPPMRRCWATPSGTASIWRSSAGATARRWFRQAMTSGGPGREFAERVDALAAGFLALGLERGARIGVWSLNRPEWTLTQFAAAKAGLILVTINPAYRLSELEFALAKGRLRRASSPRRRSRPPTTWRC